MRRARWCHNPLSPRPIRRCDPSVITIRLSLRVAQRRGNLMRSADSDRARFVAALLAMTGQQPHIYGLPCPLLCSRFRTSPSLSAQRHCCPAPASRSRRRPGLPGRPQRFRQIDTPADRRRSDAAGLGPPFRAARRDDPLSAAGARFCRFRHHAVPMSKPAWTREADEDRYRARYLLEQLGLTGNEDPETLSGGEARRAALARVLAPAPDILLLDEPTNHLDLPGIEWLEAELAGMRSGIVLISHDRRLLERISRATVWLDRGITRVLDQGFDAVRSLARPGAGAGGNRAPQAGPQDRDGGGLAALRRHRSAQAQPEAARATCTRCASSTRSSVRAAGQACKLEAAEAELSGRLVIVAEAISQILWRPSDGAGFLHPHSSAATAIGIVGRQRRRQDHVAQHADR